MNTTIIRNENAKELLSNSIFLKTWKILYDKCNWVSSFQMPIAICLWYDNYNNFYDPIILVHKDGDNRISGLLFLAISRRKDSLIQAGGSQFEYQGWITEDNYLTFFFIDTCKLINKYYNQHSLKIKYLNNSFSIERLEDAIKKNKLSNVLIEYSDKPVIELCKLNSNKAPLSRSNRTKYNRLNRIGDLKFKVIENKEQFIAWLDQIIDCYDFRQKAINNSTPFYSDPNKREFFIDLFVKGLLHVTVMSIGDKLVSTFIGNINGKEISNLIPTHAPTYAKHSPGLIHIKLLSFLLAKDGYEILDLTPGVGEKWKFQNSNKTEKVYSITFNTSKKRLFFYKFKKWLLEVYPDIRDDFNKYKSMKMKVRIKYQKKKSINRVKHFENLIDNQETILKRSLIKGKVKKNNLHDLLFAMNNNSIRKDFFYNTLKSLESNCDIYTNVQNEKLISYCIVDNTDKNNSKVVDFYSVNNDSKLVNEFGSIIFNKSITND